MNTTEKASALAENAQISPERIKVLSGLGKANSPAEREWQAVFVRRCGYSDWTRPTAKLQDDNDYEGAILARDEGQQL